MNEHSVHEATDTVEYGHQPDRVNVKGIIVIGLGLAVMVLVSMIGMVWFFRGLDEVVETELPAYASPPQDVQPPMPQLNSNQSEQLRELRARHRRILSTYGWVDEEAGVARIPIDRAIELSAGNLPVRNQP